MKWRITLTHEIEGSVVISEPEGLISAIIGFTRHPTFHSLVKEFKSAFRIYGSNGTQDGRRDWVKNIEQVYGPDAVIQTLIEFSENGFKYETLSTGEVGIQTIFETLAEDHALEFTPVQTGRWRKFISRYDVPVNIFGSTNLDGETVSIPAIENLIMTQQALRMLGNYKQKLRNDMGADYTGFPFSGSPHTDFDVDKLITFSPDFDVRNELPTKYNLATEAITDNPAPIFIAEYGGSYNIDISLCVTMKCMQSFSPSGDIYFYAAPDGADGRNPPTEVFLQELKLFIKIGNAAEVEITRTSHGQTVPAFTSTSGYIRTSRGEDRWCQYSDILTETIDAGTPIYIYFRVYGAKFFYQNNGATAIMVQPIILGDDNTNIPWNGIITPLPWQAIGVPASDPMEGSRIILTADTIYPETEVQSILVHDLGAALLDRITDSDSFYSENFGSPYTRSRAYLSEGRWWNNINFKIIQTRGYSLSEKIFSASFKDYWEGLDPMFNQGLGYETIGGSDVIEIRDKADYYDDSSMSVLLSGVQRINRKYGPEYYNNISTGYNDGKTEDINGIDDPQKQTRASIFKNIGTKIEKFTTWIGQGMTIEQARRTTKTKSADYQYDNNIAVVEVTRDGTDYKPRLDEDFTSVTGILNEDSRYNKHHTPARFFIRWLNYFSNGLQNYLGTDFRFVSGEGNYDMVSTMVSGSVPDSYDGDALAENANITVGTDYICRSEVYDIEHYMTIQEFKTIDANRRKAIGISQNSTDHKAFFIDDMKMEIMTGQVKITGRFKEYFNILTVPPGGQIFQGGKIFDASFDYSFE